MANQTIKIAKVLNEDIVNQKLYMNKEQLTDQEFVIDLFENTGFIASGDSSDELEGSYYLEVLDHYFNAKVAGYRDYYSNYKFIRVLPYKQFIDTIKLDGDKLNEAIVKFKKSVSFNYEEWEAEFNKLSPVKQFVYIMSCVGDTEQLIEDVIICDNNKDKLAIAGLLLVIVDTFYNNSLEMTDILVIESE